jgi:hypothetical protein
MPLIYGEGMQAFRRLQEQIIKSSVDLTTFAWEKPLHLRTPLLSPLATSPARFAESHCIENYKTKFPKFSVTNKGLLLSIDIPLVICHATLADGRRITVYMIHLGIGGETLNLEGGIYLRKIGPDLFCRAGDSRLAGFEDFNPALRICASRNTTVLLDTRRRNRPLRGVESKACTCLGTTDFTSYISLRRCCGTRPIGCFYGLSAMTGLTSPCSSSCCFK